MCARPDVVRDIIVVGPCGSGKTTLVKALRVRGYRARVVAQEHSGIRELWRHAGEPRALVLLEAERSTIARRREDRFPAWLHEHQMARLASARAHADLVITTDHASAEEVVQTVLRFLGSAGIMPHDRARRS